MSTCELSLIEGPIFSGPLFPQLTSFTCARTSNEDDGSRRPAPCAKCIATPRFVPNVSKSQQIVPNVSQRQELCQMCRNAKKLCQMYRNAKKLCQLCRNAKTSKIVPNGSSLSPSSETTTGEMTIVLIC